MAKLSIDDLKKVSKEKSKVAEDEYPDYSHSDLVKKNELKNTNCK